MKQIAIITGATSGIGRMYALTVTKHIAGIEEMWVISRNPSEELIRPIEEAAGCPVRPFALDLSDPASYQVIADALAEEKPHVRILMNCSGYGKFCATDAVSTDVYLNMMMLNCGSVMGVTQAVLPYLSAGDSIVNIASVAAFQPVPYINVYAATKAFVLSYTRALGSELHSRGIRVLAVCPFWTKTKFFARAINEEKDPVVKKYAAMYQPEQIVTRTWRDLRRGKDVSKFGFVARFQAVLAKLLPHRFVMWYWKKQQSLK